MDTSVPIDYRDSDIPILALASERRSIYVTNIVIVKFSYLFQL